MSTKRELTHCFFDGDRQRKVEIYRLEEGRFSFEELTFVDDKDAWIPVTAKVPTCDTLAMALEEAQGRVTWLSQAMEQF